MADVKPLKIGADGLIAEIGGTDTISTAIAPGSGGGGGVVAPGTEVVNTSGFTATMGEIAQANSTSGAITVTAPSSPSINNRFAVVDARATSATNNITVDFTTGSQKLYGSIQNYILNAAGGFVEFIYMGTATGWIATKG